MQYVASGFWIGVTIGRILLGFPAAKFGEKLMVWIYAFIALCIQLIFWFVPSVPVSAVSVSLIGFFIGPIFPCSVALATKVLPGHLHVSVIGFIAAFGIPTKDIVDGRIDRSSVNPIYGGTFGAGQGSFNVDAIGSIS